MRTMKRNIRAKEQLSAPRNESKLTFKQEMFINALLETGTAGRSMSKLLS